MLNKNIMMLASLLLCSLAYLCEGSFAGNTQNQLLEVIPQDIDVVEFTYLPIEEGYKYSYILEDGRRHQETAYVADPNSPTVMAYIMNEKERRSMPRPKGVKNRKLSPKSLQSLAG